MAEDVLLKLIKELENKPLEELSKNPIEFRIVSACSVFKDDELKKACVKGFIEALTFAKERFASIREKLMQRLRELER